MTCAKKKNEVQNWVESIQVEPELCRGKVALDLMGHIILLLKCKRWSESSSSSPASHRQHSKNHTRLLLLGGMEIGQDVMNQLVGFCSNKPPPPPWLSGCYQLLQITPAMIPFTLHTQILSPDEDDIVCSAIQCLEASLLFHTRRLQLCDFLLQRDVDVFFIPLVFAAASRILLQL